VKVELSGDAKGKAKVHAGDALILAEPTAGERTIEVEVDVDGSAHWALSVEVAK
jgi:hypothetical protein